MSEFLIEGPDHAPYSDAYEWKPAESTHDEIAELTFAVLEACRENGVNDSLRQAHAIAVALKLAEADR